MTDYGNEIHDGGNCIETDKGYVIMKKISICAWLMVFLLLGFVFGAKIAQHEPTPHECISVCVEEFEKYGC